MAEVARQARVRKYAGRGHGAAPRYDSGLYGQGKGSVGAAQEWARGEATKFIDDRMGEAKRINDNSSNKTAVPDTALYAFSQGAHTIMDGSPPAHREFQVYDLAPFKAMFLINPVTAALAYKEAIDAHGAEEAREPTQDEMNRMVDDMRMQYLNRFGREMYEQAVSPAEREAGVVSKGARVAIIDITGVPTVDTHVASVLIRASQAVRILDAEVVLTGIRSRVARTLVELGVDLGGLVTRGSLQASITYAQSRL